MADESKAPTVVGAISETLFSEQAAPASTKTAVGVQATPRVRAIAQALNVDLAKLKGTGPGGVVTEDDVKKAARPAGEAINPEKYGSVERKPFVGIRRSISQRLMKTTGGATPLVTHFDVADVTALDEFRKKHKATYLPFIIKSVVAALQENPMLNAQLDDEKQEICYLQYYNVGIAVDTPTGLMVPVIKDADKKSIAELGEALTGIAERARTRKITLDDMRGGSFTISNVGAVGGMFATPLMNYPQSAILAPGRVKEQPVVRDGKIAVGKILPLSVTFDHRLVDGADAARFCNKLVADLARPEALV